MDDLREVLNTVQSRIKRYGTKGINEQNTKSTLIQPVLKALGWNVEDLDDVQMEYKRGKQDKPVDYALLLFRDPCLFIEAKALGENLEDRRWANQIMGYASVAGIEWVVLTDGNEYRLYNSHATVPIEEKLFRVAKVSDSIEDVIEILFLLSKARMHEKNDLNALWKAHFVDRQVRAELETIFSNSAEPDTSLVRLLNKRLKSLTSGDIRASLRRAEVHFDFPVKNTSDDDGPPTVIKPPDEEKKKPPPRKRKGRNHLVDLIDAGKLKAPTKLYCRYKGHDVEATLLRDGKIEVNGTVYDSLSTAATAARESVIGKKLATNGWTFWKISGDDGKLIKLESIRDAFSKQQ